MANNQAFTLAYRKLLVLTTEGQVTSEPLDLGNYNALAVQLYCHEEGHSTSNVQLQHAATNDDAAFDNLGNALSLVSADAHSEQDCSSFLRYVRYRAWTGTAANPVVSVHIIAKE